MTNIIHIILLFMFGAIIVAPLVTNKLFLVPNLITNIFILFFLVFNSVNFNEITKFLLFSMSSTFFMIFILKYLRESAVNVYLVTRENFYYSNLDMLSKLLNRRAWYSLSMKHCKENFSQDVAFMMIDIDYFKKVNDTYGHDCGDLVIQEVAKIILENSPTKSILGRLGGEEFGILFQSITTEEAVTVSEKLRQIVENKEINYNDKKIKVTLSIGLIVKKETELDSIVKLGDEYLYKAKNSGRNRVMSNIS